MHAVNRLLEALEAEMSRAADSPDVEAVHDLRVSVRRASAALRLFRHHLPDGAARRIRREIRQIRERAAAVRDRDVTLALLHRNRLPAGDPACAYLRGQRDLAAAQLRTYLAGRLQQERPRRWAEWLREGE